MLLRDMVSCVFKKFYIHFCLKVSQSIFSCATKLLLEFYFNSNFSLNFFTNNLALSTVPTIMCSSHCFKGFSERYEFSILSFLVSITDFGLKILHKLAEINYNEFTTYLSIRFFFSNSLLTTTSL